MSSRVLPAVIAVVGGVALAFVLLLPYVLRTYRSRGELGWRPALVAFGFLVYALAIGAYTLLPLPTLDDAWCAAHTALRTPQTNPMQFVADIVKEQRGSGLHGALANPAVQQLVFNVALFVPLGAYLRHSFRRGVVATIAIGFAVSLLVECTQLTGNWFLFPCPYRVFDVDDLAANTIGTAIGVLFAPLLAVVEGRGSGIAADVPRPVTTVRRLLGMLLDLVGTTVLAPVLLLTYSLLTSLVTGQRFTDLVSPPPWLATVLGSVLPVLLVLVVPALTRGATLGQRAVMLRRTGPNGGPAPLPRLLVALLTGTAGFFLFSALGDSVPLANALSGLLIVAAPIGAFSSRGHRGFSGWVSGLSVVDARASAEAPTTPVPLGTTPRR